MSDRVHVNFKISVECEIDGENPTPELQHACECAGARFMELLEARLDAAIQDLRKLYPDCDFKVGQGPDDGEEWKEE